MSINSEIDIEKDTLQGYRSKTVENMNLIGAGKMFLNTRNIDDVNPTYDEAKNDPKVHLKKLEWKKS